MTAPAAPSSTDRRRAAARRTAWVMAACALAAYATFFYLVTAGR